jgi:hypothetical protein
MRNFLKSTIRGAENHALFFWRFLRWNKAFIASKDYLIFIKHPT